MSGFVVINFVVVVEFVKSKGMSHPTHDFPGSLVPGLIVEAHHGPCNSHPGMPHTLVGSVLQNRQALTRITRIFIICTNLQSWTVTSAVRAIKEVIDPFLTQTRLFKSIALTPTRRDVSLSWSRAISFCYFALFKL